VRRPRKPDPDAEAPGADALTSAGSARRPWRCWLGATSDGPSSASVLARGCPAALVEPVLDALAAERLLSDERFVDGS